MRLIQRLKDISSIFFDTAPIIYYLEAHADYGPLVSDVVRSSLTQTNDLMEKSDYSYFFWNKLPISSRDHWKMKDKGLCWSRLPEVFSH
jgi:uncharacterized membrane protein